MSVSRITTVSGTALTLPGADIDTDRIIPARFLKTVTFEGLERGLFADDRTAAATVGRRHPFNAPAGSARILVVNANFGCGSSREHAPQALYRWGIRAIIGESFAEIFFSNSVMIGLPCVSLSSADIKALMQHVDGHPAGEVVVDLAIQRVSAMPASWPLTMPGPAREALTSGHWDGAGLLLDRYDEVEQVAARLPY